MIHNDIHIVANNWCNIFGDDTNGASRVLGGQADASAVERQWFCPTEAIGRFRMECEHGHRGQIMKPCGKHFREFSGKVTYCPRCNAEPPGHNCTLTMVSVS